MKWAASKDAAIFVLGRPREGSISVRAAKSEDPDAVERLLREVDTELHAGAYSPEVLNAHYSLL